MTGRSDAFRRAMASGDPDAVAPTLAGGVTFSSPAVHRPYEGHDAVMTVLAAACRVLHPLAYTDTIEAADRAVLFFTAEVGGRRVEGIDALRFDTAGRIRELVVMIRPLSALQAVVDAMRHELNQPAP